MVQVPYMEALEVLGEAVARVEVELAQRRAETRDDEVDLTDPIRHVFGTSKYNLVVDITVSLVK